MIAKITGKIQEMEDGHLLVEVGGIGYKLFVSSHSSEKLKVGNKTSLWTYLVVRETILDLYGFRDKEERRLFELLIGVSGIGPKSALAILSLAPVETLRKAVVSEDASYLTKVSGIGKKSAQKIVLELKDKLGKGISGDEIGLREESEALEALKALGYTLNDGREALKKVSPEITGTNERIKEALRNLGNG